MSGAIATITQPTGVNTPGEAGKARQDLWLAKEVVLSANTAGNTSYEWTLLDGPLNSTATVTNDNAPVAGLVPDKIGTYRLLLKVDGGGWGNEVIVLFRVRYSSAGVLENRGWAYPAVGENLGEGDYDTNERSYAEVFETIFEDIRLNGMGGGGGGSAATLVFRPGGTEKDNVYITWAALMAAFDATEGLVDILIDDSISATVIPDGTWDLENRGTLLGDGTTPADLQIGNGTNTTRLQNPAGFKRMYVWSDFGDDAAIEISGRVVAEDTSFANLGATEPLLQVGITSGRFYLRGNSTFSSSNLLFEYTQGSGSTSIYLEDTSNITANTLKCALSATIYVFLSNTVTSCSATQPDVAGTLTINAPAGGITLGGDLGDWDPAGDDVQRVVGIDAIPAPLSETAANGLFVKIESTVTPKYPRVMLKDGDDILWIAQHNPDDGDPEPELSTVWLMDLSDNSLVTTIDLGDTVNRGIRAVAQDDDYVYFSGWKAAVVAIVSKTTRAVVGWGSLTNGDYINGICADNAGSFYGVGRAAGVQGVYKWSTAACIGALPDPDISAVYEALSNTSGDGSWGDNPRKLEYFASYLWLTGNSYTTELSKLDPSTLARVAFSTETDASMSSAYDGTYVYVTNAQATTLDMFDTSCVKQASWTLSTEEGVKPDEIAISDAGDTIVFPGNGYDPDYCAVFSNGMVDQQFAFLPTTNGRWGSVVAYGTKAISACFSDNYGDGPGKGLYEVSLGPVPAPEVSEMDISIALVCAPIETIAGLPVADTALAQGSRIFWDADSSKWDYQGALTGYTQDDDTGTQSTAVGELTGSVSGTGEDNSFFGFRAGYYTYAGGENTYLGSHAGYQAQGSGFGNTAVGAYAMRSSLSTMSYRNSCLGVWSGYAIAGGFDNVLVGYEAGDSITTGAGNVVIGKSTETSGINSDYEIVIGHFAQGKGSGHIVLGTTDNNSEAWIHADTMHLGNEGGVDKYWYFQNSASGAQPGFKWNQATQKVQWSHDGGIWVDCDIAFGLQSLTTAVYTAASAAPTAGQVLTAVSGSFANWQTPSGGGLTGVTTAASTYRTAVGESAGQSGTYTVNVGYQAGQSVTTAVGNVNVGPLAGGSLATTPSDYNVNVGYEAGASGATGAHSVNLGYQAGKNNIAAGNVLIGSGAGTTMSSAFSDHNTFVGYHAGTLYTAGDATIVGYEAGARATNANAMTAFGYRAGYNYTGGGVFIGELAGGGGTVSVVGGTDIIIGPEAGYYGSDNGFNVVVGFRSGFGNSTTRTYQWNTMVGYYSGYAIQSGQDNAFFGSSSGRNVTTGSYSVYIGYRGGWTATTGDDNVCVGDYCDVAAVDSANVIAIGDHSKGPTDSIAIGQDVILTNSNSGMISMQTPASSAVPAAEFWIGDSTASITVKAGAFTPHSDVRIKKNIEEIPFGLDFILGLRPRLYDLKVPSTGASKRKHMGFVAQELKEDTNKKGLDGSLIADDDPDSWAVDYNQLVAPLVKAVQELSSQVTELKKELAELKAKE